MGADADAGDTAIALLHLSAGALKMKVKDTKHHVASVDHVKMKLVQAW